MHPNEVDLVNLAQYSKWEQEACKTHGGLDQFGEFCGSGRYVAALQAQRERQLRAL